MIRTKISAVTSVTYGLLSALIIAVIVGGLSAAGVGVEKVFSAAGNAISANAGSSTSTPISIGAPNSALTAAQQSQITNAAAEIAAGTASAACLQNMNSSANAASMASNNATCLGPGYGIAPPPLPVALEGSGTEAVEPNGLIYAVAYSGSFSTTSAVTAGSNSFIFYRDGQESSGSWYSSQMVTACPESGQNMGYSGAGTPSVINGNELACAGITAIPGGMINIGKVTPTANAPFGYGSAW